MTRQRNDSHSTEFGLWLREQEEIDSKIGFITTNLDFIWMNYKTGKWMLIEEKRYMAEITYAQRKILEKLNSSIRDVNYRGFHLIQFEKTNPDDGKIYLDNKEISKEDLIKFLLL